MKPTTMPVVEAAVQGLPEPSTPAMRVLQDYLTQLERGVPPHLEELLAQHPQFADVLKEYLASLEFLHGAALNLRSSDRAPEGAFSSEPAELGQLGDFHILREVGRGGMGIVYEAIQISLGRQVAMKVLPFAAALDPKQLQRFKNEAQAAAHLQHQHIVPVYYVGCERGVHFYAMQYIEGQTLAAVIRELRQLAEPELATPAPAAQAASALARELASGRWEPSKPKGGEVVRLRGGEEHEP
jgi:hypothetical protein